MNPGTKLAALMPDLLERKPEYKESINPDRDVTRFVFFPGNVIDPKRSRELTYLRYGGEEDGSPCLLRTKGAIPRLRLTPLEKAPVWMPRELILEGMTQVAPPPMDFDGRAFDEHSYSLLNIAKGRVPGVWAYPGDALISILSKANNDMQYGRKGIVEIESLKGYDVEGDGWREVQFDFFGGAPNLGDDRAGLPPDWPLTLREAKERIIAAQGRARTAGNALYERVADEMLGACEDFYWWGSSVIAGARALGKVPANGGFVHHYAPIVKLLCEQLEQALPEDEMKMVSDALSRTASAPVQTVDTNMLIQMIMQDREAQRELMAKLSEKFAGENAAAPPKPNQPNQPQRSK